MGVVLDFFSRHKEKKYFYVLKTKHPGRDYCEKHFLIENIIINLRLGLKHPSNIGP